MIVPFVLDSNFFIQAHRMHYPLDVVPSFWGKVVTLVNSGMLISLDKVRDELYLNNDDLTAWCKENLPTDFFKPTDSVINEYIAISRWANSRAQHYTSAALSEFLDANEADAWLVAFCLGKRYHIVTQETSEPNAKKKIKIPDACIPHGVKFVNTIDMFRMLGERF